MRVHHGIAHTLGAWLFRLPDVMSAILLPAHELVRGCWEKRSLLKISANHRPPACPLPWPACSYVMASPLAPPPPDTMSSRLVLCTPPPLARASLAPRCSCASQPFLELAHRNVTRHVAQAASARPHASLPLRHAACTHDARLSRRA